MATLTHKIRASPYFTLLTPMKKVQITATYSGTTYPIFSGFITSYVTTYPDNSSFDDVAITTIQAVDAFRLAQLAQISTVTGATAGDLSGTRINQILDEIDWPASQRDIDAGLTTLQKIQALTEQHCKLYKLQQNQSMGLSM
jgi:hypothetical protein